MDTGLYYGLRLFDYAEGKPELTENDFYCEGYIHKEYVVLNPSADKLLPMGVKLPSSASGNTLVPANIIVKMVCHDSEDEYTIVTNTSDWVQTDVGGTYIHYLAVNTFTSAVPIPPGKYHLVISNVVMDVAYSFYTDTFILKRYIPATT